MSDTPQESPQSNAETIVFEGKVSARDGRPFVIMTCALADGEPVFATQLSPSVVTALGLRAIQSAIEAERDAGMVAFLHSCQFDETAVGAMLMGLRDHRQQFDAAAGSMRKLADDDPSEVSDG